MPGRPSSPAEIDINSASNFDGTGTVNPNLREVRVMVRYKVYGAWRTLPLIDLRFGLLVNERSSHAADFDHAPLASAAGYSLIELARLMAIFTVIMGATMSGLSDVIKGNETVLQMANMNNSIRAGMDLMVRDSPAGRLGPAARPRRPSPMAPARSRCGFPARRGPTS